MIDAATDLILWQWPVKVIVTVAFYAFALKGLERLVRNGVSFGIRLKRFVRDSEAVDYSTRRRVRRGSNEKSQAFWQMFTWWITHYGQKQREPLDVNVLTMPSESRSNISQFVFDHQSDFGPRNDREQEEPER
ncbi:MAG: hypothetical protein OXI33_10165 [Chloroflexota bacterium]|nr:hypothetical protein [Chloroflexota bacterium]